MTLGTGIAVAGMWLSIATIILGYEKAAKGAGFSPFGILVVLVVAASVTASVAMH